MGCGSWLPPKFSRGFAPSLYRRPGTVWRAMAGPSPLRVCRATTARPVWPHRAREFRGLPDRPACAIAALVARIALPGMISIERLSKRFETARGTSHLALSDISLDVAEGEFVSILGPSGCGKSTLLYIVGGFVMPSERRGARQGRGRHRAGAGSRPGVPGVRAVSLEDRARQRDVRADRAGRAAQDRRGSRARADRDGASQGLREFLSRRNCPAA